MSIFACSYSPIDKNSLWGESNKEKKQLYVKRILAKKKFWLYVNDRRIHKRWHRSHGE
jgi:hypothetical protein